MRRIIIGMVFGAVCATASAETAYFLPTNRYVDCSYTTTYKGTTQLWLDDYVPTNANDVVYIGLPDAPMFGSGRFYPMGSSVFTIDSIAWAPYNFNFYFQNWSSGLTLRDAANCFASWCPSVGGVTFTKKSGTPGPLVFQRIYGSYRPIFNAPAEGDVICISNLLSSGVIEKRGAGELRLARPTGSRLVTNLKAGTLALGHAANDDMPATNRYFHLDASAPSTLLTYAREDGRTCVTNWLDADGKSLKATPMTVNGMPDLARCPFISDETAPSGVHLVSFGGYSKDADDVAEHGPAACMWLSYQSGAREIFQVVKVNGKQGHGFYLSQFYADGFRLTTEAGKMYTNSQYFQKAQYNQRLNGVPFMGGQRDINSLAVLSSFDDYGGGSSGWYLCFNYGDTTIYGGYSAAEVLVYDRVLTEDERQATIRYLTKKWLQPMEKRVCDAGVVSVRAATTETRVDAGQRADVRAVRVHNLAHELVKTGEGDLAVEETYPATAKLRVKGGRIVFTNTKQKTVDPQPAAGAYLHVDATRAASFIAALDDQGQPTGKIVGWKDWRDGKTLYYTNDSTVVENAEVKPGVMNGLAAVDFGTVLSKTAPAFVLQDASGEKIPTFTAAFVVWENITGSKDTVPYPFGGNAWGFIRSSNNDLAGCMYDNGAHAEIQGALWTVNGEPYNRDGEAAGLAFGAPMVLGIGFPSKDRVCYLGKCQPGAYDGGGLRIGEVLLYARPLTDAERLDTEAYLLKKWKGVEHPAYRAKVGTLAFDNGVANEIAVEEGTRTFAAIEGAGALIKTGAGAASVEAVANTFNALEVRGGSLNATYRDLSINETLSAASYHFDAEAVDSMTTRTVGNRVEIIRMNHATSATGGSADGTVSPYRTSVTNTPTLVETEIAGRQRKVIDFGAFFTAKKNDDGVYAVDNDAASFKISSGEWNKLEFYAVVRDTDAQKRKPIFDSWEYFIDRGANGAMFSPNDSHDCFGSYALSLDGEDSTYSTALPSGWHVVALSIGPAAAPLTGFGSTERGGYLLMGGQQIAEMLVFDKNHTHDEAGRKEIVDYLCKKWLRQGTGRVLEVASMSAATNASLAVDAEGYQTVQAGAVGGAGTITLAKDLGIEIRGIDVIVATDGAVSCTTVEGAATLQDELTVRLKSATGKRLAKGSYPIFRSEALSALPRITFEDPATCCRAWRFRVEDGALYLDVVPAGMAIILR